MRHRRITKKLGRITSHREAMLKNMAIAVFFRESVRTTKSKAKVARSFIDKLITIAKNNTPESKRRVFAALRNKEIIDILFDQIAPRFKSRSGGYTRVIPLYPRPGDGTQMAILELVEKKPKVEPKVKPKKAEAAKGEKEAKKAEKPEKAEPRKEPQIKPEKAATPKAEEKPAAEEKEPRKIPPEQPKLDVKEDIRKEKAKHEELRMKKPNIFKNIKNVFGWRKAPK